MTYSSSAAAGDADLASGGGPAAGGVPSSAIRLPGGRADRSGWPRLREVFASRFATRTREEWVRALEGVDACVAPVLDSSEAPGHPHLAARGTFISPGGNQQPAPAPRFGGTPARTPGAPPAVGAHRNRAGPPRPGRRRIRAAGGQRRGLRPGRVTPHRKAAP